MWFLFAFGFALTTAVSNLVAKSMLRMMDEYQYLFLTGLIGIPTVLFIVLAFYQIPQVNNIFLINSFLSVSLGVVAAILAFRAIKISEISLVAPIAAFNPVFTAIISFLVLGESISQTGILGILFVSIGAYILNFSTDKRKIYEPLISFYKDKGIFYSLIAYFLWAVTSIFQKIALQNTNPINPPFVSLVIYIGAVIVYSLFIFKKKKETFSLAKKYLKTFVLVGVLMGVGQALAFIAFSLTNLGLATAVFKLDVLIIAILGWVIFKEHNFKNRLFGTIVMLLGVFLIVL